MRPLVQEVRTALTPEGIAERVQSAQGAPRAGRAMALLRSSAFDSPSARYSLLAANPFLMFRSFGSRCEISGFQEPAPLRQVQFGNPWRVLESLMARFELLDEIDLPFPLGGCFGFWGYDLKNFTEPKLPRRAANDLELPDCHVGFYDSLVVFDHQLGKTFVVSTGLDAGGSRSETRAAGQLEFWNRMISPGDRHAPGDPAASTRAPSPGEPKIEVVSNLSRAEFLACVRRAQDYIRAGDIYQVNLAQRLSTRWGEADGRPGWEFFKRLGASSPAPFSAYLDCGGEGQERIEIASSSPEQFLRMSGGHVVSRPIKGTRPRHADPTRDAQLAYELQTSPKELSELVMITDLLRNDLGKICEFGSVQVPELARLERFAQVQHLVSTVEGRLRPEVTHFAALASCFPGGSITGAPKFRAMEIIDELEPMTRGPYCGCHGYLGFNRESQLSITIRTAICRAGLAHFHVGAGIVADSIPEAEYDETLAKARGLLEALQPEISGGARAGRCAPR